MPFIRLITIMSKKNIRKIQTVLVLPFLNEQKSLKITCQSLGFGINPNQVPQDTTLILIDNGSTDGSLQVAASIKDSSPESSVIIGHESEKGYVPPRHKGNMLAQEYAEINGWNENEILILQADADTVYCENYVGLMTRVAQTFGTGNLFQASADYPLEFKQKFPEYIQICNEIDTQLERYFAPESIDVIVDDKLSGYILEDYFKWGCHQREYTSTGDEIHSETARLYIKSRAYGSRKIQVEGALALPSMRKTVVEPALHFAAVGFPREKSWVEKWRREYQGPTTITRFCDQLLNPEVQTAFNVRGLHIIALFNILPFHVAAALNEQAEEDDKIYRKCFPDLPNRTIDDVKNNPGIFFTDVFHLLDSEGTELIKSLNIQEDLA